MLINSTIYIAKRLNPLWNQVKWCILLHFSQTGFAKHKKYSIFVEQWRFFFINFNLKKLVL